MKRKEVVKTAKSFKGEAGHKEVVDIYNAIKPLPQGYKMSMDKPWCATFVSAVFAENGYTAFAECSCPRMVEKARKAGIWQENDSYKAQIGDVVLYDWQDTGTPKDNVGVPDHVGIIISVSGGKYTVREGNKGGTIGNRDLAIDGKFIRGFITPKFDEKSNSTPKEEKPKNEAPTKPQSYNIGSVYTVNVKSALNVRKGPGTQYSKVGYENLTADAKKHAIGSALKSGTRVTCKKVQTVGNEIWIQIPSGWICAETNGVKYVV